MLGNSWVAAQLAASQKEHNSRELFFTALKLYTRIKENEEGQYYTRIIVHKDTEMFRKSCHQYMNAKETKLNC
jgi:hypothetical protein